MGPGGDGKLRSAGGVMQPPVISRGGAIGRGGVANATGGSSPTVKEGSGCKMSPPLQSGYCPDCEQQSAVLTHNATLRSDPAPLLFAPGSNQRRLPPPPKRSPSQ